MMRKSAILGLGLLVSACGAPERTPDPTNTTTPAPAGSAGGYVKRVLALPIGQQRGVVLRAIQDGGGECDSIDEFKPQPVDRGRAVWAARCHSGSRWIVDMGDDGYARASGLPGEN